MLNDFKHLAQIVAGERFQGIAERFANLLELLTSTGLENFF